MLEPWLCPAMQWLCFEAAIGIQTSVSHIDDMRMWALWLHPSVTTNPARAFPWSGRRGHRAQGGFVIRALQAVG